VQTNTSLALVLLFCGLAAAAPKPAQVELGRRLFMDPAVSRAGLFSCASCHDPEHGFSDGRVQSEDENGETRRHSQPLTDLMDGTGMHWDGEFDNVRELLVARLAPVPETLNQARKLHKRHFDMAASGGREPHGAEYRKRLASLTPPYYGPVTPRTTTPRGVPMPVAQRLQADGRYAEGFRRAYGSRTVTLERVIDAVEAYVLSLKSGENAFDRYRKGDRAALTESQARGLELFRGRANCAACHAVDDATFTDREYHNTGVEFKHVRMQFGTATGNGAVADGGRGSMSFVQEDLGLFKTPTLRDVARRPPYMHDGSLRTLRDVVRYYDRGGTPNGTIDKQIRELELTGQEVDDLVAFLHALSSDERPGIGPEAVHRPAWTRVRIQDFAGKPIEGLEVEVHPFGDRLGRARQSNEPIMLQTNAQGWIRFPFPRWTHVTLKSRNFELGEGRPLPDYVSKTTLVATPHYQVSVRIIAPHGTRVMPAKITAYRPDTKRKVVLGMFLRKRSIASNEAIYVSARGEIRERRVVMLDYQPKKGVRGFRSMDFSGGATETIDLRPVK